MTYDVVYNQTYNITYNTWRRGVEFRRQRAKVDTPTQDY